MEKKEKATSTSYALRAFRTHLETLRERQLMSEEEYREILDIYKQIKNAYLAKEFGDDD